jgi:endo-1,4-beta-xylanase
LQKRSSISRARYLVAALAVLAAGCGADAEPSSGPIPVDSDPIAPTGYVKPLGAAVEVDHALEDGAYRERLITTFTSITPENAMKWAVVEPERGEFDFKEADRLVQFAERTSMRVRGHPLVWDQQLPDWLTEGDWSAPELKAILREHIRTIMNRYRGRIDEWDVVNEPSAASGGLERNIWFRALGPGWIEYAFRVAHRADPDATLFLNELDAEGRGPRFRTYVALARHLEQRGVPLEGVGFEFHLTGDDAPGPARLHALARVTERMGLSWAITEMDVADTHDQRQAQVYGDAARACADASHCTGVTVWGVTDRWSWLGPEAAPLPFDEDGNPKPALEALVGPLRR